MVSFSHFLFARSCNVGFGNGKLVAKHHPNHDYRVFNVLGVLSEIESLFEARNRRFDNHDTFIFKSIELNIPTI